MTWIVEQIDKVNFLDKELEHINKMLISVNKNTDFNTQKYALFLEEKELLIKYKQCINEQIKMYCMTNKNCDTCHDTTVHLVLGS